MLNHKGTQTLSTPRLILRKYKLTDSNNMFKNWATDKEVTKFLSWDIHPNIEFTNSLIDLWTREYSDTTYRWVIELKKTSEVIGDISVFNLKNHHMSCEIGYCLSSKHWNLGIMSESLNAVIKYLFEEINLNRIVAMHSTENISSGKVMIKNNMKYEGILRQARVVNNEFSDLAVYSILKSEYGGK